jgi:phosphotransferase system HPr (HPr) family protein
MIERHATVRNAHGIHCRPAAMIILAAKDYAGRIDVRAGEAATDLRSILDLVAMELPAGTGVTIHVSGPDEEAFCGRLVELFERHFDFPPTAEERTPARRGT